MNLMVIGAKRRKIKITNNVELNAVILNDKVYCNDRVLVGVYLIDYYTVLLEFENCKFYLYKDNKYIELSKDVMPEVSVSIRHRLPDIIPTKELCEYNIELGFVNTLGDILLLDSNRAIELKDKVKNVIPVIYTDCLLGSVSVWQEVIDFNRFIIPVELKHKSKSRVMKILLINDMNWYNVYYDIKNQSEEIELEFICYHLDSNISVNISKEQLEYIKANNIVKIEVGTNGLSLYLQFGKYGIVRIDLSNKIKVINGMVYGFSVYACGNNEIKRLQPLLANINRGYSYILNIDRTVYHSECMITQEKIINMLIEQYVKYIKCKGESGEKIGNLSILFENIVLLLENNAKVAIIRNQLSIFINEYDTVYNLQYIITDDFKSINYTGHSCRMRNKKQGKTIPSSAYYFSLSGDNVLYICEDTIYDTKGEQVYQSDSKIKLADYWDKKDDNTIKKCCYTKSDIIIDFDNIIPMTEEINDAIELGCLIVLNKDNTITVME